jgi:hypothetical protein
MWVSVVTYSNVGTIPAHYVGDEEAYVDGLLTTRRPGCFVTIIKLMN